MRFPNALASIAITFALLLVAATPARALAIASRGTVPQTSVEKEYKRLLALRNKLARIPMERLDREPNKSYIRRNKKDIVYSDPAGQWFVRSDRFWDLAKNNKAHALADDIAWAAAENPLPGECEGYVNCYVYNANATVGEYLRLFPAGKHKKQALADFRQWIEPMTADGEGTYDGPTDASDKAELKKMVTELRSTFAKVKGGTEQAVSELDRLVAKYK